MNMLNDTVLMCWRLSGQNWNFARRYLLDVDQIPSSHSPIIHWSLQYHYPDLKI